MKKLTFTKTGWSKSAQKKVSAAQIDALEEQLGCKLPNDYREFLLEHNGGEPTRRLFHAGEPDADLEPWVDHFLFVDEHLAEPNEQAHPYSLSFVRSRVGRFVPDDCLIIGSVSRDELLLLRIRGRRRGQVDLKSMDETELGPYEEWAIQKERGVYPIAKSFSQFVQLLHEPADPYAPVTFALDSPRVRGKQLEAILRKLGCKKWKYPGDPQETKRRPAWHWPKFQNTSDVGGDASLSVEKNKTYGYEPKFDERPEGHEMLLVSVTKSQRSECIRELTGALGQDAPLLG